MRNSLRQLSDPCVMGVATRKKQLFSSICVNRRPSDAATRVQAPGGGFLGGLGQELRVSLQAYARMTAAKHKAKTMHRMARLLASHVRLTRSRDPVRMFVRCWVLLDAGYEAG